MGSYICLGTYDMERAKAFYDAALASSPKYIEF